jgi:hypothetical protein
MWIEPFPTILNQIETNYVNLSNFLQNLYQFNQNMSIVTISYNFKSNWNELCEFK